MQCQVQNPYVGKIWCLPTCMYKLSSHIYIGEIGRQIRQRLKEHMSKNGTSAFSRHLQINGHIIDNNIGIRILHHLDKPHKITLLKAYEIKKAKDNGLQILNEQIDLATCLLFISYFLTIEFMIDNYICKTL